MSKATKIYFQDGDWVLAIDGKEYPAWQHVGTLAGMIAELDDEIDQLRALLRKYGSCQEDCASREEHATWVRPKKCNCGWDGVKQAKRAAGGKDESVR